MAPLAPLSHGEANFFCFESSKNRAEESKEDSSLGNRDGSQLKISFGHLDEALESACEFAPRATKSRIAARCNHS